MQCDVLVTYIYLYYYVLAADSAVGGEDDSGLTTCAKHGLHLHLVKGKAGQQAGAQSPRQVGGRLPQVSNSSR